MPLYNNPVTPVNPQAMAPIWNLAARNHVAKAINSDGFITAMLPAGLNNLYHYTNASSLHHILTPRLSNTSNLAPFGSLRASCSAIMNDIGEYEHGEIIISDAIQSSRNGLLAATRAQILLELGDTTKREERRRQVFLFSMSMVGDLKSQWMEYADAGKGISIGFDVEKVRVAANDYALRPYGQSYPVIYDDQEKKRISLLIVESFADWFDSNQAKGMGFAPSETAHQDVFRYLLGALIASYVPILKNRQCFEEKEWRNVVNNQYQQIQNAVEPHMTAPGTQRTKDGVALDCVFLNAVHNASTLPASGNGPISPAPIPVQLPITEIIVGPNADFASTKTQIEGELSSHGYVGVPVRRSTVPYAP